MATLAIIKTMMEIIKSLAEKLIKDKTILTLTIAYISLLGTLFVLRSTDWPLNYIRIQLEFDQSVKVTVILLLSCIYLLAIIIILNHKLRSKPKFTDYAFNSLDGIWKHKKTDRWICASCKTENILSELYFVEKYRLKCPRCEKEFDNFLMKTSDTITKKPDNFIDLRDFKFKK